MSKVSEVYDYLKKAGTYYLATIDGTQPRVRPFGTIDEYNEKLYILTSKNKNVAKQIEANPKVELSAMVGNDWIRIEAEAYAFDDVDAQKHMLDAYPSLQNQYKVGDPNTGLYELKNGTATFYSFVNEPKSIKF